MMEIQGTIKYDADRVKGLGKEIMSVPGCEQLEARSFQRKGLGMALARELAKLAVNSGIEKMVVSVVENQVGARRAFEKLGFQAEAVPAHPPL
jgi:histone acetyltransferase (RNA polymerase elongator complex component)